MTNEKDPCTFTREITSTRIVLYCHPKDPEIEAYSDDWENLELDLDELLTDFASDHEDRVTYSLE